MKPTSIKTKPSQEYVATFCECCGQPLKELLQDLSEKEFDEHGKREIGNHYQLNNQPSFDYLYTKKLVVTHCSNCGEILSDEEIETSREEVGEFWGSPAYETFLDNYTCGQCGHHEEF